MIHNTSINKATYGIGQIVRHKLFDYRGVIFDVDYRFQASDEWYEQMARSRPAKDQPWYHVLVDNADYHTYVAEINIELSTSSDPIKHPFVASLFSEIRDGAYVPLARKN